LLIYVSLRMMRLSKLLKAPLTVQTTQNPNYIFAPGSYLIRVSFPSTSGSFSQEIPFIPNTPYITPSNPLNSSYINVNTTQTINNQFRSSSSVTAASFWYTGQRDLFVNLTYVQGVDPNSSTVTLSGGLS